MRELFEDTIHSIRWECGRALKSCRRVYRRLIRPMVEREPDDILRDVTVFRVGDVLVDVPATAVAEERYRSVEQIAWQYALDGRGKSFPFSYIMAKSLNRNAGKIAANIMAHNDVLRSIRQ